MFQAIFVTADIKSESLTVIRKNFFSKTEPQCGPIAKGNDCTTVVAMDTNEVFRLGAILALGGIDKAKLIEYGEVL